MKIPLILLLICGSLSAQSYRKNVKLLTDSAGKRLYAEKSKPENETVGNLSNRTTTPKPAEWELQKDRRAEPEKRKVTVTAYLVASGFEADGDYHLVLQSLKGGETLIAEIPDPNSPNLKNFTAHQNDFEKARNEIDTKTGRPTAKVKPLSCKRNAVVTGYIFFDKHAHGKGHAANDLEIHPVLTLKVID